MSEDLNILVEANEPMLLAAGLARVAKEQAEDFAHQEHVAAAWKIVEKHAIAANEEIQGHNEPPKRTE